MTPAARTAAATAGKIRKAQERKAAELRGTGWISIPPKIVAGLPEGIQQYLHHLERRADRTQLSDAGRYGADLTDAELAQHHLGYGPGADERTDGEFWCRFPHLGGWYQVGEWLWQQHVYRWIDEQVEYNPMTSDLPPSLPVHDELMNQYKRMVQDIAEGHHRVAG